MAFLLDFAPPLGCWQACRQQGTPGGTGPGHCLSAAGWSAAAAAGYGPGKLWVASVYHVACMQAPVQPLPHHSPTEAINLVAATCDCCPAHPGPVGV